MKSALKQKQNISFVQIKYVMCTHQNVFFKWIFFIEDNEKKKI